MVKYIYKCIKSQRNQYPEFFNGCVIFIQIKCGHNWFKKCNVQCLTTNNGNRLLCSNALRKFIPEYTEKNIFSDQFSGKML